MISIILEFVGKSLQGNISVALTSVVLIYKQVSSGCLFQFHFSRSNFHSPTQRCRSFLAPLHMTESLFRNNTNKQSFYKDSQLFINQEFTEMSVINKISNTFLVIKLNCVFRDLLVYIIYVNLFNLISKFYHSCQLHVIQKML